MKIAVVGLGKIGSCLLACLAYKGFDVIGVDLNKKIVEKINHGIAPFPEPQLQMMIQQNREHITATTKMIEAIPQTDIAFIRVATPSEPNGGFNSQYIEHAIADICRCIPDKKEYYTIVNTSTVMPGTMKEKIEPLVEQISNRRIGPTPKNEDMPIPTENGKTKIKTVTKKMIGLCYMPDWVALGTVITNILNPDMILIGESDPKAGDALCSILNDLSYPHQWDAPIHRMNFYNAEATKLLNNNYISMKISFTNTVTEYCEKLPGGDAKIVLEAIGEDSRIGSKFLKPGLGYSGFCFPRDQKAFIHSAITKGINPILHHAVDKINENIDRRISVVLRRMMDKLETKKIAILGYTFKPDTPYTKESTTLKIIENLTGDSGITVSIFDPSEPETDTPLIYTQNLVENIEDCLKDQKLVFIGTPWKQFHDIDKKLFKNKTIVDSFGILQNMLENESDVNYIRIGTNKFKIEIDG